MNNIEKIIKGINLYPTIKDKYINIVLELDMRKEYKEIFGVECSFEEFIREIKNDSFTRFIIQEIIYEYYGFKRMPLITDSSFEKWYFIDFIKGKNEDYTFSFVEKIASMNTYSMLDDYVDLFNNKIEYKMA